MWETYNVVLTFRERLCGSVPQSKELIRPWLEARKPESKPENATSLDEIEEEVLATLSETEERITLGFQEDVVGLFVRDGVVKAHLKDCGNQVRDFLKIKALRAKIANKVYVEPSRIYLVDDNFKIVKKPHGEFERAVHVMTPLGPRDALKRIQYVEKSHIEFNLMVLADKVIDEKILEGILEYGAIHGLGGERGMGEGKYTWDMVKIS